MFFCFLFINLSLLFVLVGTAVQVLLTKIPRSCTPDPINNDVVTGVHFRDIFVSTDLSSPSVVNYWIISRDSDSTNQLN